MELDSRIIEGKRPLTCFDVEEAKKYIGKDCYFASKLESFENLSKVPHATLHNIDDSHTPFWCYGDDAVLCYDCFILPCEWVKEEKKYRAYTLAEWIEKHEIGEVIHYRSKSGEIELRHMYVGTRHSQGIKKIILKITLGNVSHTLDYLFEEYEIEVNGEWKPFGIEVKE